MLCIKHAAPAHLLILRSSHVLLQMIVISVLLLLWGGWRGAGGDFVPLREASLRGLAATLAGDRHVVKEDECYEYVVVGGGGGGAAAAGRLAAAGRSVLLLEAGGDPPLLSEVPAGSQALLGSAVDWQYRTRPNGVSCLGSEGSQCRFSRGRMLGGSTGINYMMYVRGNRQDYELGIPGWSWEEFEPFFLRAEGLTDLDLLPPSSRRYHNTTGPLPIGFCEETQNRWHDNIVRGLGQLGFPYNPDVNAASQIGASRVLTYTNRGRRTSSATYLQGHSSLRVATHTTCTGVDIDEDNVARGVTVLRAGSSQPILVRASRGVVLAAGAVGTPHLLQLSGVGPAGLLRGAGLRVAADLPVGDDMSDHVLPLVFVSATQGLVGLAKAAAAGGGAALRYVAERRGELASIGLTDITAFANTSCYDPVSQRLAAGAGCELPTLQLINAYVERGLVAAATPLFKRATQLSDDIISQLAAESTRRALLVVSPVVLAPASRGWVRLAGKDPLRPPDVFPNYLGDERDVDEMLRAITIMEDLVETEAYRSLGAAIVRLKLPACPAYEAGREEYWRCYVRHLTFSVYHACGTAALGRVLDARLRVRGVSRLRVADLSALPRVPRGNTAAAAIALGERAAHMLLQDEHTDNHTDTCHDIANKIL